MTGATRRRKARLQRTTLHVPGRIRDQKQAAFSGNTKSLRAEWDQTVVRQSTITMKL